jgi:hypothetical protein
MRCSGHRPRPKESVFDVATIAATSPTLVAHRAPRPPNASRTEEPAPWTHETHPGCTLWQPSGHARRSARRSAPRSLGAARAALALLAVLPLYGVLFPEPSPISAALPLGARDAAAVLWLLSFAPAWWYLRQPPSRRRPLPLLAILGLEYGMYFALSPLLGLHNVYGAMEAGTILRPIDPVREYLEPVRLALVGWIGILAGYGMARVLPLPKERIAERVGVEFDAGTLAEIGARLLAVGVLFELMRWTAAVPLALQGTIHFLSRIALIGLAMLFALRARGLLSRRHKRWLLAATMLLLGIEVGSGATYNVILVCFFAVVGSWIGRPRAGIGRVVTVLVLLAAFASVRGVMNEFRRVAWWSGVEYPLVVRARIMLDLFDQRLERSGVLGTIHDGMYQVAERSANIDLFADVVRRTPAEVPYWGGETYKSLVGLAIPRFLWPEKPVKLLGQDFGHRYRYLGPNDRRTHINVPMLVEFYVNFGALGVAAGSLIVGVIYGVLERYLNRPRQALLVSAMALSLLQPLLVLELDFSLQLGGLFMNGVALVLLYRLLRHRWRDRLRRPQSITSPRRTPAVTASVRVDTRSFA